MFYVFASVSTYGKGKCFFSEEKGTLFLKTSPGKCNEMLRCTWYQGCSLESYQWVFEEPLKCSTRKNSHHHNNFLAFQVNPQRTQFFLNSLNSFWSVSHCPEFTQFFHFFLSDLSFSSILFQFFHNFGKYSLLFFIFSPKVNSLQILQYIRLKWVFVKWTLFGFSKHCKWQLRRAIK